ncbi:unnamed protein product [Colias eurytheme]|nr:unnamed protein product [Colias eurytheme]
MLDGSTHACKTYQCGGGVGRNIAEALWRLRNGRTKLLTALGNDADGKYIQSITPGLVLEDCTAKEARTATYAAMFDKKGECLIGLGDMEIHNHISIDLVNKHLEVLKKAPLIVIDGNIPQDTMDHVLQLCHQHNKPERKSSNQYCQSHLDDKLFIGILLNKEGNVKLFVLFYSRGQADKFLAKWLS